MKIGILVLMVIFLAILIGLFILSYKMLRQVHQEEKNQRKAQAPIRELHPKLKQEQKDQK